MCVCVYVYLYMYRHIYMSVYVCVHVSMCVYIHIHRLIHTGDGTHDSAAHVGDKRARAPQGASRSGPGAHPHMHMRARARAHTHTHTHTAGARSGKNGHAPEDIADRPPSETVACCSNSRRRFQATSHTPASTPGGQTDRGCVYVWGGWWMQAHATGFYAYMRYLHTHITRTAEGRRGFGVIGARRHDRCPRPPCLAECRTFMETNGGCCLQYG